MSETALWVIGILLTVITAGASAFLTVIHGQMSGVLKKLDEIEGLLARLGEVKATHDVRIDHLERNVDALRAEVAKLRAIVMEMRQSGGAGMSA